MLIYQRVSFQRLFLQVCDFSKVNGYANGYGYGAAPQQSYAPPATQ